jgi:hypothetical protein
MIFGGAEVKSCRPGRPGVAAPGNAFGWRRCRSSLILAADQALSEQQEPLYWRVQFLRFFPFMTLGQRPMP